MRLRPPREDDIGAPGPNLPDHFFAGLEAGDQFAIVIRQYLARGDTQTAPGLIRLATANFRERRSGVHMMAGVTAGHGEEFHLVFQGYKLRRGAAEPVFAIVRVGPDA